MFLGPFKRLFPIASLAGYGFASASTGEWSPVTQAFCEDAPKKCKKQACDRRTELEKCAERCRKECKPVTSTLNGLYQSAIYGVQVATVAVGDNIQYLQKCADRETRTAVILGAGVLGVLAGYRRRWPRKILYGAIASGVMCGIIHPKEFRDLSRELCAAVGKFGSDAYKNVTGERPSYKCPDTGRDCCPKKECRRRETRKVCRTPEGQGPAEGSSAGGDSKSE